jgi:hypothetical protein
VLHIATVHKDTPRWVEIQTRHLRENIRVPYQTWTSIEGIDSSHGVHFDHVIEQKGAHPAKLNHLALEITHRADPADLLMFLDGDAFPIGDPIPLVEDALARAPLVAARRDENLGDPQPHPCFCVTTVGTWRSLPGDWSSGYEWTNSEGRRVSDTGANLLRALELTNTPWVPVLRTNKRNPDPIFFGIYGDVVYHHGAGFRRISRFTRYHASLAPKPKPVSGMPVVRALRRRANWRDRQNWDEQTKAHLEAMSESVIAKIERGGSDWLADLI